MIIKIIDKILSFIILLILSPFFIILLLSQYFISKKIYNESPKILHFGIINLEGTQKTGWSKQEIIEMFLLNTFFSEVINIYLDFESKHDKYIKFIDNLTFIDFSVHPQNKLEKLGLKRLNTIYVELKILFKIYRIIIKKKISIIQAFNPHIHGINAFILSSLTRCPYIIQVCSNYEEKDRQAKGLANPFFKFAPIERFVERFIMKRANLVIADRDNYINQGIIPESCRKKYYNIGFYVNKHYYLELELRKNLKKELNLLNKKIMLYVGRLNPVKFVTDLIDCAELVFKQIENTIMIIVGEGILRKELEEKSQTKKISDKIIFLGHKSHEYLANLYYTADVIVFPSAGFTIIEAALSNTPIVAYDFEWHGEFIENGITGILVPFRDIKALSDAVLNVLSDVELSLKLSKNARIKALENYTYEKSFEKQKIMYEQLMKYHMK